jgi:4,5-dihydroxyphthalate decarboxylase
MKPIISVAMSADPRTLALIEGKVGIDDYQLRITHDFLSPGEQHHRFEQREFDVCEFSTAMFLRSVEAKAPFIALPVFFTRGARQRNIFYREGNLKHPGELRGKKIGLSRYGATANVWARGFLLDEYGLRTTDMRWYVSGHELFFGHDLPVKVERPEKPMQFGKDRSHLGSLLSQGKIDAVIVPGDTGYQSIFGGGELVRDMESFPGVKALLDDTEEIIRYIQTKHVYPIMHTIAMTTDTAARYPDLPMKLTEAFRAAKKLAVQYMSPEEIQGCEKEKAVLGEDPYAYVLGKTEIASLKALNRYQIEQGLMKQELEISSLFVPDTIGSS